MPLDVLVRGASVVTPSGVERLDIGIEGGRFVRLEPEILAAARETIDAGGLHALPATVDTHVHFNEPGRTHWESIATGSAALAAGGGALFADMPLNAIPPTLDRASFDAKRRAAEASSVTDFALWGGLTPANLDRLVELAECGVIGFKAFMSASGVDEFEAADDLTLLRGMETAARLGLPVAVHAESDAMTRALAQDAREDGRTSAADWAATRPVEAELEAITTAIALARETGADLHIVHVSSGAGARLVRDARRGGVRVTCETCPHYLHFTLADFLERGALLQCAPPLRDEGERARLWDALHAGDVDFVASDHSPAPADLKDAEPFDVRGGINGVQATLGVLLAHGDRRGLPLETVARLVATAPAERYRLSGKGRIAAGYDADLALVDLAVRPTLRAGDLRTRHRQSPYVGEQLHGAVVRTLVRGRTVHRPGHFPAPPTGRLVTPAARKGPS